MTKQLVSELLCDMKQQLSTTGQQAVCSGDEL